MVFGPVQGPGSKVGVRRRLASSRSASRRAQAARRRGNGNDVKDAGIAHCRVPAASAATAGCVVPKAVATKGHTGESCKRAEMKDPLCNPAAAVAIAMRLLAITPPALIATGTRSPDIVA